MSGIEDIIDRIQDILEKSKGEKVYLKDIAEALGMSSSQLSNFKSRNAIPYDKISEYCAKNRISINWVLYGQSIEMLNTDAENIYRIKLIDNVHSSAGGGAFNEDDAGITYLTVDPVFVDVFGIKESDDIEAVRVAGDSMEPTISEGALILLDRKKAELVNGGIFVLNSLNGVVVKRIAVNPNGMIDLISDNKIYPVQSVPGDELKVIGKVVGVLERV